jgi:elongator complex protein 3
MKIKEIRFREIGFNIRDKLPKEKIRQKLNLKITKYKASDGEEYFLEIVNADNILFALCRLRITQSKIAYLRELHVYGQSLPIGEKGKSFISQHRGLGKFLMAEAEKIALREKSKSILVISGIGAREYYRKLGYSLKEPYMAKNIS